MYIIPIGAIKMLKKYKMKIFISDKIDIKIKFPIRIELPKNNSIILSKTITENG